jgi:hypothetical protein
VTHHLTRKYPAGSNSVSLKMNRSARTIGWRVTLVTVLVLLPVGPAFGDQWIALVPPGQPAQIRSQVKYDPKLSDPFFESDKWSCPRRVEKCAKKDRLKNTAKCHSSLDSRHPIHFCEAKCIDGGGIELLLNDSTLPQPFDQYLLIVVKEGVFWSQYWVNYEAARYGVLTWTTKKQVLTLDKRIYHKGDVIKGRIAFECAEDETDPLRGLVSTTIIKLEGAFKTILQ